MKVPIHVGVKLFANQCPKTWEEEEDVSCVPYVNAVGSLMHAMVCAKPYITHVVQYQVGICQNQGRNTKQQ